jgi:TIR domain
MPRVPTFPHQGPWHWSLKDRGTLARGDAKEAVTMHVFISWSGDLSRQLAQAIRNWLPGTLQYVKPYFTPTDIEKGTKWDAEVTKELDRSQVCIIALTRESLNSRWIMFEAGAISRSRSRVCAILFDLETTDVQGPLERFQATKFSKGEIFQLVGTINSNAGEQALSSLVLETVFEKWWPDLESEVRRILTAASSDSSATVRSERSLLEETLALVRNLAQEQTEVRLRLSQMGFQPRLLAGNRQTEKDWPAVAEVEDFARFTDWAKVA